MKKRSWQTDANYSTSVLIYLLFLLDIKATHGLKLHGSMVDSFIV